MTLETQEAKTLYWAKTGVWAPSEYDTSLLQAIEDKIERIDFSRRFLRPIYNYKCHYCGKKQRRERRCHIISCSDCRKERQKKYQYLYRRGLIPNHKFPKRAK